MEAKRIATAAAPMKHANAHRRGGRTASATVVATMLAALLAWPSAVAVAAQGDCSQPNSTGDGPKAADCLFILRVAVGLQECSPPCICAPGGALPTKASDALLCLRKSVGQNVVLACPCAGLPDHDDFNDNSKDPALWGLDFIDGNGVLEEAGQVLRYTCASGTDYDQSLRDWLGSNFPYDADWEVQVDVANFTVPSKNDQVNSFGISVIDADYFGNEVFAELYASHIDSPPARNGFYAALYHNESFESDVDTATLPVTTGAVRVTFTASTKVIRVSYDIDPTDGYDWVEFGSFGVDGSGGADDNVDWGMTDGDTFQASLYGFSSSMAVGAGTVYGDNFQAFGGVPAP